jgi:hypothetical protein
MLRQGNWPRMMIGNRETSETGKISSSVHLSYDELGGHLDPGEIKDLLGLALVNFRGICRLGDPCKVASKIEVDENHVTDRRHEAATRGSNSESYLSRVVRWQEWIIVRERVSSCLPSLTISAINVSRPRLVLRLSSLPAHRQQPQFPLLRLWLCSCLLLLATGPYSSRTFSKTWH